MWAIRIFVSVEAQSLPFMIIRYSSFFYDFVNAFFCLIVVFPSSHVDGKTAS